MPLAAEHDIGAGDERRGRPRSSPSTPSSPMPTMDSQRVDGAVFGHDRLSAHHAASSSSAARPKRGRSPARLAGRADLAVTLSLAGRTARTAAAGRAGAGVGGFGGADGLADYLRAERIDALIDATHPYAAAISANAARAAAIARVPLLALRRAALDAQSPATTGSRSRRCERCGGRARRSAAPRVPRARPQGARAVRRGAAASLSRAQRRSRRSAARRAAGDLLRPRAGRSARQRTARCSSAIASTTIVAKNSGGEATYGKIAAARALGICR